MTDKLVEYLRSEEGQNSMKEFFDNIRLKEEKSQEQLKRFWDKYRDRFSEIVLKVIDKYDSEEYVDRWRRRGIEPPESLYYFFFDFAEKFGREATTEEYDKYGNTFTSKIVVFSNVSFNMMFGQGSAIKINFI